MKACCLSRFHRMFTGQIKKMENHRVPVNPPNLNSWRKLVNLTLYDYINMPKNDTKSIKRIKASYKVRNLYMWHVIIGSNFLYVFDTGQYENLLFIYLFIKIMKLILWYNKPPVTSQLDQFWFAPCYDNAKGWLDLMINRADNPWYPPTGLPNQVLISFH